VKGSAVNVDVSNLFIDNEHLTLDLCPCKAWEVKRQLVRS